MCGRFSIFTPLQELRQRFNADPPDEPVAPSYNAAPGQRLIVVPMDNPAKMHLYRWGLIPHWTKDEKIGHKLINARAETLRGKMSFRGFLQKGRCLVLADGFYEWNSLAGRKTPYRIELKNQNPFAMAGLCSKWKDGKGVEIDSFTIITTRANTLIRSIHDRMPVILNKDQERSWLDTFTDPEEVDRYLVPYPGSDMKMYPISTLVNNPKNNNAEVIKPLRNAQE